MAVSITMQAGWPAQELVNAAVQQAVLLLVCYMYEQRVAAVQNPPAEIEHGVRALLVNYSLLLED
ncbi:MAG: head-tail connector protein [Candidatus Caldarchaeum sp.]